MLDTMLGQTENESRILLEKRLDEGPARQDSIDQLRQADMVADQGYWKTTNLRELIIMHPECPLYGADDHILAGKYESDLNRSTIAYSQYGQSLGIQPHNIPYTEFQYVVEVPVSMQNAPPIVILGALNPDPRISSSTPEREWVRNIMDSLNLNVMSLIWKNVAGNNVGNTEYCDDVGPYNSTLSEYVTDNLNYKESLNIERDKRHEQGHNNRKKHENGSDQCSGTEQAQCVANGIHSEMCSINSHDGIYAFAAQNEGNSSSESNSIAEIDVYINERELLKWVDATGTDNDGDGVTIEDGDCDDTNPNINPNQTEEPYNGLDDDCDSLTLDDDLDQDGFLIADDCDDENSEINPDAMEIPNNGIDEDCDGMDLMTSIHEISNSTVSIYPNPASDVINIKVDGQLNFSSRLYDIEGKRILSSRNTKLIRVNSIPTGMYLLEIKDLTSGQKVVKRIMIGR